MGRRRVLLTSCAIVLLCLTIVLGMTWALFTDDAIIEHHLQAGDLTVTLKRVQLDRDALDEKGFLVNYDTDKTVKDFTNPTKENVFDIHESHKIVPGCKYEAKMQIENLSDVAFGYWVEIVCKDTTYGEELAKQLQVTVDTTVDDDTDADHIARVGDGLVVRGEDGGYLDVLAIGEKEYFTVCVEFLDSFKNEDFLGGYYANDKAQGQKLTFDLVVHAVQVTENPNP